MSLERGDLAFTPANENSYFPGLPNAKPPLVGVMPEVGVVGSPPCWLDGIATGWVGANETEGPVGAGGCHVKAKGLLVGALEPKEKAG